MRVALVANRSSGSGTDVDAVAAALRARGAEVTPFDIADLDGARDAIVAALWPQGAGAGRAGGARTQDPGAAGTGGARAEDAGAARTADAHDAGGARLVVAGGDGSIAPVAALASVLEVPLAVVASGTANDFARKLGLPRDPRDACALAADPAARTLTLQLARAGARPFVNAASCGLSVVAAHRATPLKPRLGPLAYAAGALRAGLTGHPIAARVDDDAGRAVFDGHAWQVIVGATGAFGGGSGIAEADPRDHLLDVVVVTAGSRLGLVRRAFGLRTGRIVRQRGVVHARSRALTIATPAGTRWNIDGEVADPPASSFANRDEQYDVVVP